MSVDFDVKGQQVMNFSLEEALLLIMDTYFVQGWWFKVKMP